MTSKPQDTRAQRSPIRVRRDTTLMIPHLQPHAKSTLALALVASSQLLSCASSPKIGEVAVTTPDIYRENRVLFVDDATDYRARRLIHPNEVVLAELDYAASAAPSSSHKEDLEGQRENGAQPRTSSARLPPEYVRRLEPIGVIVRGVRIPEHGSSHRKDIAVVLDIVTAGEDNVTSLVVFYQREVAGGQMLNFQDLLVYYDPEWDGVTPPWFRVRVLEVSSERNDRTRAFLTESDKLAGSLSGIVPHPVLPTVSVAIEAAKLILGNRHNEVLIDYQVQFYSPAQIRGAGAPLTPLRKGEWLVIGRAKNEDSSFWRRRFFLDGRTGKVHARPARAEEETADGLVLSDVQSGGRDSVAASGPLTIGHPVHVPYVSVVLMVADAAVPKHILDRSQALIQLLDSPTERANFDSLTATASQLTSALKGYEAERMLKKYKSDQDFLNLIELMKEHQAGAEGGEPLLRPAQVRTLLRVASEFVPDQSFGTTDAFITWATTHDGAKGTFVKSPDDADRWEWKTPAD